MVEFPTPPKIIKNGVVALKFKELRKGDLPFYHFRICDMSGNDVGHINFRIGDTEHIVFCAVHIGCGILESYRGNSYSYYACLALSRFVKSIYSHVWITSDPNNVASIRTIERLGCRVIDEVSISIHEDTYKRGERIKLRYIWEP